MKAYSLDLRQRVLSAALRGDRTPPEVAELFGVSLTFVNKMLRLHRSGQGIAPRPHGGGHTLRLGLPPLPLTLTTDSLTKKSWTLSDDTSPTRIPVANSRSTSARFWRRRYAG